MTTEAEYQSVDLTEDEGSSDELSYENNPLHFVDCTMAANSMSPETIKMNPSTADKSPPHKIPKQVESKGLPNIFRKTDLSQDVLKSSVGKFLSVQVKPPTGLIPEIQYSPATSSKKLNETVSIDSDEEESIRTPPNPPNVTNPPNFPQKHSGKVVVIKKNNKYYKIVIPHNVMPDISQSVGPVLINIPEVGPLVITTDPQVKNMSNTRVTQQLLNLDAIQQRKISTPLPVQKPLRKPERDPREALLCDKKYCWTLITMRKRDLEGFSMYDRLGFNRAEAGRAKKCWKTLDAIVSKKSKEMMRAVEKYKEFKRSVARKKSIKFVKINEILGKVANGEKGEDAGSGPVRKKFPNPRRRLVEAPKAPQVTEPAPYSDLLLTKKVVILNNNGTNAERSKNFRRRLSKKEKALRIKERVKKARATRDIWSRFTKKSAALLSLHDIKPCYVQMVRDECVEEAYRKYRKDRMEMSGRGASNKVIANDYLKPRPKSSVPALGQMDFPKQELFFQNITKVFLGKVIRTDEHFEREMNLLKPILMVHEYNVRSINYSEEYGKNNIVYIVRGNGGFPLNVLVNEHFISAVELGYIKLVDSSLFCKFVSGGMELEGRRHDSDHSYCLSKK